MSVPGEGHEDVGNGEQCDGFHSAESFLSVRHPERSRFSGGARDLARSATIAHARSLSPLVKTRAIGMTHRISGDADKNHQDIKHKYAS
jgi:hypothetical protein